MTRQVMVDAELLIHALRGVAFYNHTTDTVECNLCFETLDKTDTLIGHAPDCPVPALRAALTQHQPAAGTVTNCDSLTEPERELERLRAEHGQVRLAHGYGTPAIVDYIEAIEGLVGALEAQQQAKENVERKVEHYARTRRLALAALTPQPMPAEGES